MNRYIAAILILVLTLLSGRPVKAESHGTFLTDEAGIAAFFQFTGPTNLQSNLLRNQFRTLQTIGTEYLIGSIPAAGYESDTKQDIKVFIHNDGWVVAFYLKGDPTAKALDKDFDPKSRLEKVLDRVAFAIDVVDYQVKFTHFQYPGAEHILRVGRLRPNQGYGGIDTFQIRLPGANTYFERSWLLSSSIYNQAFFHLDGKSIGSARGLNSGTIPAVEMVTNAKHIIGVESRSGFMGNVYGELVVLYSGTTGFSIDYADMTTTIDLSQVPQGLVDAASEVPRYFDIFLPLVKR